MNFNMKNSVLLIAFATLLAACGGASQQTDEDTTADTTAQAEPAEKVVQLSVSEVEYTADTLTMKGYVAYDMSMEEKRPGVLVIHEWWGHNDYARKRADMLAELGYVALAVDMYGDGKQAAHPEDAGKFAMNVMSNLESAKQRFEAALAELKMNPMVDSTKIAAIGYCFGGSVALSMANAGYDLDGVAAFHSGLQLPVQPQPGEVKAKVLVCNGAADTFVPAEHIEAFKAQMDSAGVDYKYVAYEGAVHGYTNPEADSLAAQFGMNLKYDAEADKQSWEELKQLLASIF